LSRKLFGTDGIRGVAGEPPLDERTAHAVGVALGEWARCGNAKKISQTPEVVIGIDTRESGPWLAAQVAGGLKRSGVGARFAGVITTPGVACLARTGPYVAGVMISASHNPYLDNGIKITPPDLNSTTDHIFIPRSALSELTVLGVVGIARRKPAAAAAAGQPRLFNE